MEKEMANSFEGSGVGEKVSAVRILLRQDLGLKNWDLDKVLPDASRSKGRVSSRGFDTLRYSVSDFDTLRNSAFGFSMLFRYLRRSKVRGFGDQEPFSNSFSLFPFFSLSLFLTLILPISAFSQTSFFQFPITVPYTWMDNYIDKEMKGILYADTSYLDGAADHLKVDVRKAGKLRISGFLDYALVRMPLRIAISKQLGFLTLDTDFDIELVLKTRVSMDSTWHLRSATQVVDYAITRNPVVPLGGRGLDVKFLLKAVLDQTLPGMVRAFDKAVYASTALREQAQDAWKNVQEPTLVDTGYQAWLRVVPMSCGLAPVVFLPDAMKLYVSTNLQLQTCVGYKPAMGKPLALPPLRTVHEGEEQVLLRMPVWLSYAEISRQATRYLKDTVFQVTKKRAIQVDSVGVEPAEGKLRITVLTSGALRSRLVFEGRPVYDTLSKRFAMEELRYDLKTRQALAGLANRLFRARIRRNMQEAFRYDVGADLKFYQGLSNAYLKDYVYEGSLKVNGTIRELELRSLEARPDYLYLLMDVRGAVQMSLKN